MSLKELKDSQPLAAKILSRILQREQIAPAYLFVGPKGAGKKLAALEFAKSLNCEAKNKDSHSRVDSCRQCPACEEIEKMTHPDVRIVSREKDSISIQQMRQLQKEAYRKPFSADYKVYIIEQAEEMNAEAANSLLKILEEPPQKTIFILTASSLWHLFPTIISRCQPIRFRQRETIKEEDGQREEISSLLKEESIHQLFNRLSALSLNKENALKLLDFLLFSCREEMLTCCRKGEAVQRQLQKIALMLQTRRIISRNVNPQLGLESLLLNIKHRNFNLSHSSFPPLQKGD